MVNGQNYDDLIETLDHPLLFVFVESVVKDKHHVGLVDIHAEHDLSPQVRDVDDDGSHRRSSAKVEQDIR